MDVSRHAVKRIRQRLGLPKKAAQADVERALERGLKIEDCVGRLRRYLDYMRHTHGDTCEFRVTPSAVYVVAGDVLVTVFPLPNAHKKQAAIQYAKAQSDA